MPGRQAAFHHAHQHDGAAIDIEPRIENQRAQRRVRRAFRRRNEAHDRLENFLDSNSAFRADQERVVGGNGQHVFDLFLGEVRPRGGQIDFIDDRDDREIVPRREKSVGDRLRLDSLACVHHQQRALAGGERAGNLVRKIHVPRRINQVQLVFVAVARGVVQADALGFDRDAAFALEVHRIEHLRAHFALGERARQFEQPVGQGGFPVVDVRDDAEIPNELEIHGFSSGR